LDNERKFDPAILHKLRRLLLKFLLFELENDIFQK